MEPYEIFGSVVAVTVGAVVIAALLGWDHTSLIHILPAIIFFAFILALIAGVFQLASDFR